MNESIFSDRLLFPKSKCILDLVVVVGESIFLAAKVFCNVFESKMVHVEDVICSRFVG